LESLIETLEIMSDPELMESIRRGLEDIKKGDVIDFEELMELDEYS
jgi:PHD/YefM family antitoxin component YafN of YafNO toxin-antitoxin module